MAFTFAYAFIPNTRVHLSAPPRRFPVQHPLAVGPVGLHQLADRGRVNKYNAIYGSFAQLPLLLVWLYISWGGWSCSARRCATPSRT
jgi:membrane protein